MKHLKKFNEELKPDTYRSAGGKLDYYNKSKRASALVDYADEKEFGFYKLHFANINNIVTKFVDGQTFTNPSLIGIYIGPRGDMSEDNNILHYKNRDREEALLNKLVNDWKEGNKILALTFEFGVKATRETLTNTTIKHFKSPTVDKKYVSHIPIFAIELEFSEWYDGIEEWDYDAKVQARMDGEEFTPSDVYKFFDWTKSYDLTLAKPLAIFGGGYFAIFADRRSAQKFKNWLLSIVDDKIKSVIMELLSIVGGEAEDIERAINKFKNIRLNALYDDEKPQGTSLQNKWYDKRL
jgi:hypothetical protein